MHQATTIKEDTIVMTGPRVQPPMAREMMVEEVSIVKTTDREMQSDEPMKAEIN
jgi:hypothetical protein